MKSTVNTNFLKIVSKKLNPEIEGIVNKVIKNYDFDGLSLVVKFYSYRSMLFGFSQSKKIAYFKFNDIFLEEVNLFEELFPVVLDVAVGKIEKWELTRFVDEISMKISNRGSRVKYSSFSPVGKVYNLTLLSREFNSYLESFDINGIFWSKRSSKRKLGYADMLNRVIIISKILDSVNVPDYVIKFIIFHEILHFMFPPVRNGKRSIQHGYEFRDFEKKCKYYKDAMDFLEENDL